MTIDPAGLFNLIWPLAHKALFLGLVAAVYHAARFLEHGAQTIHDQRLRGWALTLVHAAEAQFQSPQSGMQKKQWVLDRLKTLFPRLPYSVASALVDGVFQGMAKS